MSNEMQHYEDGDKSQELVTGITGSMEPAPSREVEMEDLAAIRESIRLTDMELRSALSGKVPMVRTIPQGGEAIFRTVPVAAGVATQVLSMNFRRSKATLTGTGANVAIGADQNLQWTGAAPAGPLNGTIIGYAASFFVREVNSVREVWVLSDVAILLGIQEEFYA